MDGGVTANGRPRSVPEMRKLARALISIAKKQHDAGQEAPKAGADEGAA